MGPPLAYRAERASWTTAEFFRLPRQLGQETWNDVFFLEIMGWFTYALKVIYLGDEMHPKFQLFAIWLYVGYGIAYPGSVWQFRKSSHTLETRIVRLLND